MQVGIGRRCDPAELQSALAVYFPTQAIHMAGSYEEWYGRDDQDELSVVVCDKQGEFPIRIELWPGGPDETATRDQLWLARFLSLALRSRTICDGTEFGDGDPRNPYWSVVWDGDTPWLADNCDSAYYGDENGGPVRLVRRLEVIPWQEPS